MNVHSIDVQTFAREIMNTEEVRLLDIRGENDHENWPVSGRNIKTLNIPFKEVAKRVDEVTETFPPEQTVYILCYKGITARQAAATLEDTGYSNVKFVEGGIEAWGEHIQPVKIGGLSNGGSIYQFIRLGKGCLSYMVVSGNEALVVDPSRTIEAYLAFAEKNGWNIKQVADTHLHADHVSGGRELANQTGASYWFPCKDGNGARINYLRLEDGLRIPLGNGKETIFSFSSPGHTLGSMSLLVDDTYLLCGDCLFIESAGRPDLAGKSEEWARHLRTTLFEQFKQLPDQLVILPAHFSKFSEINPEGTVQATLKDLFMKNPVLQLETEEEFFKAITENLPKQPGSYQKIRRINIGLQELSNEEQKQIDSGPNRCAVN